MRRQRRLRTVEETRAGTNRSSLALDFDSTSIWTVHLSMVKQSDDGDTDSLLSVTDSVRELLVNRRGGERCVLHGLLRLVRAFRRR